MLPQEDLKDRGRYYESIAGDWDSWMDVQELRKRLRILFERELVRGDVQGRRVLDAGCGTGHFSRVLSGWGADLVSVDVGEGLLSQVLEKCRTRAVEADVRSLPFPEESFDLVLCTEVIEHTPDPRAAVAELCRVLAPGGTLLLTVPNRFWLPLVKAAATLGLRRYAGFENWVGYTELPLWVREQGLSVEEQSGFNPIPHTFFCRPAFDRLDRLAFLHPFMVNMLVRGRKPSR